MTALRIEDARRRFRTSAGVATALDGVSLTLSPGEIVGLVGESGCGKTTLARIAVGLDRLDSGRVTLGDVPLVDVSGNVGPEARRRVQLVFQDPFACFNPRQSVGRSIAIPLRVHRICPPGRVRSRVEALLDGVGLDPALADRRPHMLSGGQLQRAAIARALALSPEFLVCDEPVASLDVSVRAQILNLLLRLWRETGLGILFVSHDLGVVRRIADRVVVMYLGRIVEEGSSETVWSTPRHPYTQALAAAVPTGSARWTSGGRVRLPGEPPSPFAIPPGCRFHPRCPIAVDRCRVEDPEPRPFPPDARAACHLAR